jgi:hypothetical protein
VLLEQEEVVGVFVRFRARRCWKTIYSFAGCMNKVLMN